LEEEEEKEERKMKREKNELTEPVPHSRIFLLMT